MRIQSYIRTKKLTFSIRFIITYDESAFGSLSSALQTEIGKRLPNVVATARWHIITRSKVEVLSDGLSGRGPHGRSHTSSVRCE